MIAQAIYLVFSCVSIIVLCFLERYILRLGRRKQLHRYFMLTILFLIIYNFGMALLIAAQLFFRYQDIRIEYIVFLGVTLCSVFFLLVGLVFVKQYIVFNYRHYLLFIVPVITNVVLWTNQYHGLFYTEYGKKLDYSFGPYFFIGMGVTWVYILLGISYLIRFSVKNAGFYSKQTRLIILGSIIPIPFNISWILGSVFKIEFLRFYSSYDISPITLSITIICYALAIFKYDFLNLVPIALQRIVDLISDSYVVIDEFYNIVDYNKTFVDTFGALTSFKRKDNLLDIIERHPAINIDIALLRDYLHRVVGAGGSVFFEKEIVSDEFGRYFTVEITPIYPGRDNTRVESKSSLIGIIILLKDITEHKKNIESLREQQAILLEQERLASLGQLIGGIAHNLKTPIMSLAGGIEALKDLAVEYRDSIDDMDVNEQDHKEIAKEMLTWLDKMKPYCGYMSDVISAVKGQAVQMNASMTEKFTVDELIKRVELLMKHELKKYHCVLNVDSQVDMNTEIKGEVNNLVQVFDNIIINAIQAYEGKLGTIDLRIVRSGDNIEFIFKDYARGIPKRISDRLFKEMVTTKGKNGTGLGLYMSYSTIKGRFSGNMSFTSKEGLGTTFFITVPCISYRDMEVLK